MAKYIIEESTLKGLANAIRNVNGETKSYTPTEMIEAVTHIMESATYILVDENGNEVPAVYVENEAVFTATANDIRIGMVAATESGVTTGTKEIPAYYMEQGYRVIMPGKPVRHVGNDYDYTELQAVICAFNTSITNSVAVERVAVNGNVYEVQSTEPLSEITINDTERAIEFGVNNDSDSMQILRYFYYKEIV